MDKKLAKSMVLFHVHQTLVFGVFVKQLKSLLGRLLFVFVFEHEVQDDGLGEEHQDDADEASD